MQNPTRPQTLPQGTKPPPLREQLKYKPYVSMCLWCDHPFVKMRKWARFCCPKHREEYHTAMRAQRNLQEKNNRQAKDKSTVPSVN